MLSGRSRESRDWSRATPITDSLPIGSLTAMWVEPRESGGYGGSHPAREAAAGLLAASHHLPYVGRVPVDALIAGSPELKQVSRCAERRIELQTTVLTGLRRRSQ